MSPRSLFAPRLFEATDRILGCSICGAARSACCDCYMRRAVHKAREDRLRVVRELAKARQWARITRSVRP